MVHVDIEGRDYGATQPVSLFPRARESQNGQRRLGIGDITLDRNAMDRVMDLLIAHQLRTSANKRLPRLRQTDITILEGLEDIWNVYYDFERGIGYVAPSPDRPVSNQKMAKVRAQEARDRRRFAQSGIHVVDVTRIDGTADISDTNQSLRLSYSGHHVFSALRAKWLIRQANRQQQRLNKTT